MDLLNCDLARPPPDIAGRRHRQSSGADSETARMTKVQLHRHMEAESC